jgi:hypothetical protein
MTRPSLRLVAATLVALGVGAAATARMAAFGPFVDVVVTIYAETDAFTDYQLLAKARGGEKIDALRIEKVSGPLRILGGAEIKDLAPTDRVTFQVRAEGGGAGVVRLVQTGNGARTYEVTLGEAP